MLRNKYAPMFRGKIAAVLPDGDTVDLVLKDAYGQTFTVRFQSHFFRHMLACEGYCPLIGRAVEYDMLDGVLGFVE